MLNLSTRSWRILYALSAPEHLVADLALSTMLKECTQKIKDKMCNVYVCETPFHSNQEVEKHIQSKHGL